MFLWLFCCFVGLSCYFNLFMFVLLVFVNHPCTEIKNNKERSGNWFESTLQFLEWSTTLRVFECFETTLHFLERSTGVRSWNYFKLLGVKKTFIFCARFFGLLHNIFSTLMTLLVTLLITLLIALLKTWLVTLVFRLIITFVF